MCRLFHFSPISQLTDKQDLDADPVLRCLRQVTGGGNSLQLQQQQQQQQLPAADTKQPTCHDGGDNNVNNNKCRPNVSGNNGCFNIEVDSVARLNVNAMGCRGDFNNLREYGIEGDDSAPPVVFDKFDDVQVICDPKERSYSLHSSHRSSSETLKSSHSSSAALSPPRRRDDNNHNGNGGQNQNNRNLL